MIPDSLDDLHPGHLVLVTLGPVLGTEQDGTRPALVVSECEMHQATRRMIVCPITTNVRPWPTKVFLPAGLAASGAVLADQMRSIDRRERVLRVLGRAPDSVLRDVRTILAHLLGVTPQSEER